MSKRMQDAGLDEIAGRFPTLKVRPTQDEYRVFKPEHEGRGSIWIAPQRSGYRVVTTGSTHSIDRDIERISGQKAREMSDRAHKWWKALSEDDVEAIFEALAKSR